MHCYLKIKNFYLYRGDLLREDLTYGIGFHSTKLSRLKPQYSGLNDLTFKHYIIPQTLPRYVPWPIEKPPLFNSHTYIEVFQSFKITLKFTLVFPRFNFLNSTIAADQGRSILPKSRKFQQRRR